MAFIPSMALAAMPQLSGQPTFADGPCRVMLLPKKATPAGVIRPPRASGRRSTRSSARVSNWPRRTNSPRPRPRLRATNSHRHLPAAQKSRDTFRE